MYKTENIKKMFNYAAKLASLKVANFGDAPMCHFVQRLAWFLGLKQMHFQCACINLLFL